MVSIGSRVRALRVIPVAALLLAVLAAAPALLRAQDPAQPAPDPAAAEGQTQAQEQLVPVEQVNTPPDAAFKADPDLDPAENKISVLAGENVTLDASASTDAGAAVSRYEWDLDGDGTYETDGGAGAVAQHVFATPGTIDLRLRVTDAGGATDEAKQELTVQAPLEPAEELQPAAPEQQAAGSDTPAAPADSDEPAATPKRARRAKQDDSDEQSAQAAASSSVKIVDFNFSPKTINVKVGDSVTWTNSGEEGHSATANSGEFDTGILQTGQSGSHKFTKAGTFAYICKPHPFMKATVVVAGSGGSGSGGNGGSGGSGDDAGTAGTDDSGSGDTSSGDSSDSGTLSKTGADLGRLAGLGIVLLLLGAVLQRGVPEGDPRGP